MVGRQLLIRARRGYGHPARRLATPNALTGHRPYDSKQRGSIWTTVGGTCYTVNSVQ